MTLPQGLDRDARGRCRAAPSEPICGVGQGFPFSSGKDCEGIILRFTFSHHGRAKLHRQRHIASHLHHPAHKRRLGIDLSTRHLLRVFSFHRQDSLWRLWPFSLAEL